MKRLWLLGLVALAGMIVLDRVRAAPNHPGPVAPTTQGDSNTRRRVPTIPVPAPRPLAPAAPVPTREGSRTPAIDLLARLEGRNMLTRAVGSTYFDSLFAETDSVVRRWADPATPVVVAVAQAAPAVDGPLLLTVRSALSAWEQARLGLRFVLTRDTAEAQIQVRSEEQLDGERVGLTDLEWTGNGAIHLARIVLARKDRWGTVIPKAMALAVAIHEVGHALGLSHSPNPGDVMYSATRTSKLSQRDLTTLTLLYQLPLGSIRESVDR